jgi:putative transposase
VKYAFIREHNNEFRVSRMCAVLQVSRSGYYHWLDRPESRKLREDRRLLEQIRQVHVENRRAYGAVKTWRELRDRGVACGKHRVARLRRQDGIRAQRCARFRITVANHHTTPPAPNLLRRQFTAVAPNCIWAI